jgi:hypothetical protein
MESSTTMSGFGTWDMVVCNISYGQGLLMEHVLVDFKCAKVKHDPLKVHVCAIGHYIL